MSHYTSVQLEVKDVQCFIDAIFEMCDNKINIKKEDILWFDEPENLYGYQGDMRSQKANIIIRRRNIGDASNDIGWLVENGKCIEYISDFDRSVFTKDWSKKLKQTYSANVAEKAARRSGYRVKKEKIDGKIKLIMEKGW